MNKFCIVPVRIACLLLVTLLISAYGPDGCSKKGSEMNIYVSEYLGEAPLTVSLAAETMIPGICNQPRFTWVYREDTKYGPNAEFTFHDKGIHIIKAFLSNCNGNMPDVERIEIRVN